MCPQPGSLTANGAKALCLLVFCALAGCKQEVQQERITKADAPAPMKETAEARERRWDTTVWKPEMEALRHEQVLVQLRDSILSSSNKLAVLAGTGFRSMNAPKPTSAPSTLGLGITLQEFDDAQRITLSSDAWRETLDGLNASGWAIEDAEFAHTLFVPATNQVPARSMFKFDIYGTRSRGTTRFQMKGNLEVHWTNLNGTPAIAAVTPSGVKVIERSGPSGFSRIGLVTPSLPERRGEITELAPILVADLDSDGDEDIVLAGVNQVLLNKGGGTFEPKELIQEAHFKGAQVIAALGDFNGDGLPDLLAAASTGNYSNKLVLYIGNGQAPFTEAPRIVAPEISVNSPGAITVGDVDDDGDLDVWIGQYKQPYADGQMPTPYYDANDGYPSFLLLNNGRGDFTNATERAGLSEKSHRRVIAAAFADINGDGHLDLVTANDFCGSDLFHGDGKGHFTDETKRLYDPHSYGMAIALADFDRDGSLDFFVAGMSLPTVSRLEALRLAPAEMSDRTAMRGPMTYGNRVYVRSGSEWKKPPFSDQLAETGWTWGSVASDFDNDGNTDLYLANGNISGASVQDYDSHYWRHDIYLGTSSANRELLVYFARAFENVNTLKSSYNGHQHNVLMMGFGTNQYQNAAFLMDVGEVADCRSVVAADLNHDGRMDLLFTQNERVGGQDTGRSKLAIYKNTLITSNHWIGVKLPWNQRGLSPFGVEVRVKAAGQVFVTQLASGISYRSQLPNTAHIGLGAVTRVDELMVTWSGGKRRILQSPPVDQYISVDPP